MRAVNKAIRVKGSKTFKYASSWYDNHGASEVSVSGKRRRAAAGMRERIIGTNKGKIRPAQFFARGVRCEWSFIQIRLCARAWKNPTLTTIPVRKKPKVPWLVERAWTILYERECGVRPPVFWGKKSVLFQRADPTRNRKARRDESPTWGRRKKRRIGRRGEGKGKGGRETAERGGARYSVHDTQGRQRYIHEEMSRSHESDHGLSSTVYLPSSPLAPMPC